MAKIDPSRDYYGDLELPPTADIKEIKTQFRKLALKYHPDRNPGHEAEVNAKFQTIQSAHEILSDEELRRKYDAARPRSRYPTASGVKGNPWQDVGGQFPQPPRRNTFARQQARYSNFASAAPTAKKPTADDEETKRDRWKAFQGMKPSSSRSKGDSGSKPKTEERTYKTASQQQRAEVSFGNRKSGYGPRSAGGDEPPVPPRNYASSRHPNLFEDTATDARRRRASAADPASNIKESFLDSRQSTPYQTHGGEKYNMFEGAGVNRSKSTRVRQSPVDGAEDDSPTSRTRSSSVPRSTKANGSGDPNLQVPVNDGRPQSARDGSSQGGSFAKRANEKFAAGVSGSSASSLRNENTPSDTGSSARTNGGPSMYATQERSPKPSTPIPNSPHSVKRAPNPPITTTGGVAWLNERALSEELSKSSPSGAKDSLDSLNPYDGGIWKLLETLITNGNGRHESILRPSEGGRRATPVVPPIPTDDANKLPHHRFSFAVNGDTFPQTVPEQHTNFTRSSADDINTRFVHDNDASQWQFSAGGLKQPTPRQRAHSSSRADADSSTRRPSMRRADELGGRPGGANATHGGFDAESWKQKLASHTFEPNAPNNVSSSPTRAGGRRDSRKTKVKPTMGTAGMVNDSSSDEGPRLKTYVEPTSADSPNAMDIDTPPPESAPRKAPSPPTEPRTVPVEPDRAEWRAGNIDGFTEELKKTNAPSAQPPFHINNSMGSEDTPDFHASFSDLKNVEPISQPKPTGLGSFDDLKSNLPFESRAAPQAPIENRQPSKFDFPKPPMAPRPPQSLMDRSRTSQRAWAKYVGDWQIYIRLWDEFDAKITDHFDSRKRLEHARKASGYTFLATRANTGCTEYLEMLHRDNEVRSKWAIASTEHEQRVREFMAYRNIMMK